MYINQSNPGIYLMCITCEYAEWCFVFKVLTALCIHLRNLDLPYRFKTYDKQYVPCEQFVNFLS